jgi:hippurate hydrolase
MNAPDDFLASHDEMIALRRQIHSHPELGYQEFMTSDLVAERLREWGYEVHRGLAGTGVVGTLTCGDGPRRIGLRADMDALPVHARVRPRRPYRDAPCRRQASCADS